MTSKNLSGNTLRILRGGTSLALLGLGLAGCSSAAAPAPTVTVTASVPTQAPAAATPSATTAPEATATTAAPSPSTEAAVERRVVMTVTGAKDTALVKALVVTSDSKESDAQMRSQKLPFTREVTLPATTDFTKVLVLGKYSSGATGKISCTVSIDGKEVASSSSSSHQPAECLFINKDSAK
ncbi:hypothetical protein [Paeniglutamicibacter cryotolerans]|uniref:Uncharacterized protein n=1 Tax=Paeniglutamicibacter cryotolerans TaxID=670079 RepID=A0A839QN88_9MICC|nr:hypothetical protein [Paeniglutamicibacter cryotolerans]MBB2994682.1 hypothetical protein [Paeniglutamicibacter cryotolerans]